MAFTCPECGATSQHPVDEQEGYCARCHRWTGDQVGPLPLVVDDTLPPDVAELRSGEEVVRIRIVGDDS